MALPSLAAPLATTLSTLLAHSNYQEEFDAFAREEQRGALPERPVLFYGSSTIRLWDSLERDFAGLPVLNRGFGGSTLDECAQLLDRWVTPLQPRAIVLYAGDNDLDHGAEPEHVLARFDYFGSTTRARLGWVPLLFLAIKPSPARFWNATRIVRTNALIQQAIATRWPEGAFVDLYPAMLRPDGSPRAELYGEDGLHLNAAGYALWRGAVVEALANQGLSGESRLS